MFRNKNFPLLFYDITVLLNTQEYYYIGPLHSLENLKRAQYMTVTLAASITLFWLIHLSLILYFPLTRSHVSTTRSDSLSLSLTLSQSVPILRRSTLPNTLQLSKHQRTILSAVLPLPPFWYYGWHRRTVQSVPIVVSW